MPVRVRQVAFRTTSGKPDAVRLNRMGRRFSKPRTFDCLCAGSHVLSTSAVRHNSLLHRAAALRVGISAAASASTALGRRPMSASASPSGHACSGADAACFIESLARQIVLQRPALSRGLSTSCGRRSLHRADAIHSASCEALLRLGRSRRDVFQVTTVVPTLHRRLSAGCFIECVGCVAASTALAGVRSEERSQVRFVPAEAGSEGSLHPTT